MDALTARRTLAQLRLGVGIATLVAPHLSARVMGIDAGDRATPYLLRLFGAREVYMASPFLMPAPGLNEAELASRAVPVDAVDAVAALAAGLRGHLPWRAALPGAAAAVTGAWLGSVAARNELRPG
jgi:uncharacterized membrane protein YfcA